MESKEKMHLETQNETADQSFNPESENVEVVGEAIEEAGQLIVDENTPLIQELPVTENEPKILALEDPIPSQGEEDPTSIEPEAEVSEPSENSPVGTSEEPAFDDPGKAELTGSVVEALADESTSFTPENCSKDEVLENEQVETLHEVESAVESAVQITSDPEHLPITDEEEEGGEDEGHDEESHPDEHKYDYSGLSELELVTTLKEMMATLSYSELVGKVENIKANFYKKHKAWQLSLKETFIKEGGNEDDFVSEENPYESELKEMLRQYQQKKGDYAKDQEAEKENNLKIKYEIIEEIKNLINRKESINKTFQEFKDLQQKWREIGLVPQASMKDLWDTYHHHVENFYDYIKINKELRDLDLKRNLEEKIGICEKTESLLLEPSVIKAFNALQKFHEQWREVGPVPRDKKDELWERFKAATTQINKKHQDYFENRKKTQKKNFDAKVALCEKAEEFSAIDLNTHKAWEDKSKELVELQKYWRTIGFAPKKENNEVYDRFRAACDAFFDKKREFYSSHKEVQTNNLQMKLDLCMQAEALKESTDWKKTTDEFINIQKKWKEIGPVPRKQSDIVWKRFRAACDYFFQRKSTFFSSIDSEQEDNLKLKNELIDEVLNFTTTGSDNDDFEKLREFQRRWTDIGHVPINEKNNVQKRFRDAINNQFDKLRTEDKERNLLKYKNKMSEMHHAPKGSNKIYLERDKHISKLRQLETDLITLKNNIGFFAQSKNAEALINDVKRKIEQNEEQIEYLKEKIRVIDDVDGDE